MRRALAGVLLAAAPVAALAFEAVDSLPYPSLGTFPAYPPDEARPGRLFVQAGILRDDNVLRHATDPQSETITRIGVGASYEQRVYGRQVVRLEARGDAYDYDRFDELNHFAYGVLGEWRWEVGNQLAGTLGYGRRRFQTDLAERQVAVEDLVTENRLYGTAGYRFSPNWRLHGAFAAASQDRPESAAPETRGSTVSGGLDYVTPLGNMLGAEVRTGSGDAPVPATIDPAGQFRDNQYEEEEIAAVAAYNAGAQLRFGARVAETERTYDLIPQFNFKGTTWRFDALWRPGNKTLLGFDVYKLPRSVIEVDATHAIVRGVSFGPAWAPTAKLVFSARIAREEREYPGIPGALGGLPLREEVVRGLRLAAGWEATRRFHFGAAWETGERRSNVLDRDYDYNAVMVNGRFVF
jgi:hypothetical protein